MRPQCPVDTEGETPHAHTHRRCWEGGRGSWPWTSGCAGDAADLIKSRVADVHQGAVLLLSLAPAWRCKGGALCPWFPGVHDKEESRRASRGRPEKPYGPEDTDLQPRAPGPYPFGCAPYSLLPIRQAALKKDQTCSGGRLGGGQGGSLAHCPPVGLELKPGPCLGPRLVPRGCTGYRRCHSRPWGSLWGWSPSPGVSLTPLILPPPPYCTGSPGKEGRTVL